MAREDFDDARYRQDAEREEYEREGAGGRQTDYERRRRLREKDDRYSILDDEPEAHP